MLELLISFVINLRLINFFYTIKNEKIIEFNYYFAEKKEDFCDTF